MRVRLLGPVRAIDEDGATLAIHGPQPRALLARLALRPGTVVPTEMLLTDLWDDPPASASAVHTIVSRLRRDLGPAGDVIVSAGPGYRLDLPADVVDAVRFEHLAAAASAALAVGEWDNARALADDALALWEGEPLADVRAAPYAGPVATRLAERRLTAIEDRADAALRIADTLDVPALQALSAAHPLRERLAALAMRALYATGRQAEALSVFERTRAALADELGVDPSPVLADTHVAVLRQDSALAPATRAGGGPAAVQTPAQPLPASNIRRTLTSFVGRIDDLARVAELLGSARLVTIVGTGGAGKTRLATELVSALTPPPRDGVWMVELATVHDPADVPHAVLAALGAQARVLPSARLDVIPPLDATRHLLDRLAGTDVVVVLDNCEHVIDAAAQLADTLLGAVPGVRLLATSREPLAVPGEAVCPLAPLPVPREGADLAAAAGTESVTLFVDRARALRPDFALDEANTPAVIEICRRLDGLPLAIELAAARVTAMSPPQIAQRLDDRFRLLTGGSRVALARHRTLLAVIEWSWDLLEEPERILLRRLAVFAAPAELETIERVCAGEGLPGSAVLPTLAALVDKSLVDPVRADPIRYRMLETVRAFATDRMAESGEANRLRDRHCQAVRSIVTQSSFGLVGPDQLRWFAVLDTMYDDITAALRWSIDSRRGEAAVAIVAGITPYWMMRGSFAELVQWPAAAVQLSDGPPSLARAVATTMAAIAAGLTGGDPAPHFAAVAAMREAGVDFMAHPLLAVTQGSDAFLRDDHAAMLAIIEPLVAGHPDPWTRALALFMRAGMRHNSGETAGVQEDYEQAVAAFRTIGDRWGQTAALSGVAELQQQNGDLDAALASYRTALELGRELGSPDEIAQQLIRIALLHVDRGELAEARAALAEAEGSVQTFTPGMVSAMLAGGRAAIAWAVGDLAEVERLLRLALQLARDARPGPGQLVGMMASSLAEAVARLGHADEAWRLLSEALVVTEGSHDVPVLAVVAVQTANVLTVTGAVELAAELYGAAERINATPRRFTGPFATTIDEARTALGDRFGECFAVGAGMDRDAALHRLREVIGAHAAGSTS